jgi:hypothetical protein
MFEIDKAHCVTIEQKLLYNIQELLKKESKAQVICKHCGGTHENIGQTLACAKKHKKDGDKHV